MRAPGWSEAAAHRAWVALTALEVVLTVDLPGAGLQRAGSPIRTARSGADRGMDRPTAYAYLSAAADFTISQVVDKTVGVHGVISKSHFAR